MCPEAKGPNRREILKLLAVAPDTAASLRICSPSALQNEVFRLELKSQSQSYVKSLALRNLAEREGFELSVQVLARTTV